MTNDEIITNDQLPINNVINHFKNLFFGFWSLFGYSSLVFGILLFGILFLAFFLRIWHLDSYPPLNADEAAIGYNAWSILQTGRDEHGEFLPLHFKSFGDYKPGGYFYLVVPFVKLLGLNEWAVRLPSALAGVATVWLVYRIARLLWQDEILGLVWAFVLAVSPWHIHFSRGGWESNMANFLATLGVYLFFKNSKTRLLAPERSDGGQAQVKNEKSKVKKWGWYLTIGAFVLAMYTYHSARLVVPALGLGLLVTNWRLLWKRRKELALPAIGGILLLLPLAFSFLRGGATSRFAGVGLLSDPGPLWRVNELRGQHENINEPIARVLHNRFLIYTIAFFEKYFSHFDGRFLFIEGDEVPRSKLPDMGVLHLVEAPLLILGVWFWLRGKKQYKYLPFLWLVVSPLASALTFQAPSALRALPMVVPLTFFVAYGILRIYEYTNIEYREKKFLKYVFWGGVGMGYLWSVVYWWNQYFVHYLRRYPEAWPGGFKQLVAWVAKNQDRYEKIYVTDKYDQPYILFLFYLRYPPEKMQKEIRLTPRDKFGFSTVRQFGKFCFGLKSKECEGWRKERKVLIIAAKEGMDGKMIGRIKDQQGNLKFVLFEK